MGTSAPTETASSTANYRRTPATQTSPPTIKGRRRSASIHGTPSSSFQAPPSKIGPQRTSKVSQKLKILPSPADQDEESGRDVYSQVTRIKDTTARRDAERLGKAERAHLPRSSDYNYDRPPQPPTIPEDDLIDLVSDQHSRNSATDDTGSTESEIMEDDRDDRSLLNFVMEQNKSVVSSEVFLYQYGVVVIWGMTVGEEQRFLKDIAKFESEKLADDDVQVENFNFYVTSSYQPRIYNDFITLKDGGNYMIKLSISHAIAQSVKISLFEDLVDNTIEDTKSIPQDVATTGKVNMSRRDIMKHIGELFILRININLQGSVLDSPELMWAEPQLDPVYQAARSYLEINQRVSLLNQRLDVIGDLLQMLKEQMSHSQGEHLEWIVIVLIAAEILVAVVNVVVDLFAGAD
ncbi:uncharacterized protein LAJ45_05569 [Morchella importuna]|uniref:uncharacterized protein n=1 Tax=Morchella importuna TaxID=1174673 RepID=UPI001E8DB27E|nr:uncharacterized protein LAJ45_05569 [Morchella importuna]KAH8150358.1 hypothetical protein LAJ45_05569 [Morchella importuna]